MMGGAITPFLIGECKVHEGEGIRQLGDVGIHRLLGEGDAAVSDASAASSTNPKATSKPCTMSDAQQSLNESGERTPRPTGWTRMRVAALLILMVP